MDNDDVQRSGETTNSLRGLFDLSQIRAAIGERRGYDELIKLIDRCTHHLSVVEDLRVAVATLNTLLAMGPGGPDVPMTEGDDLVRQSLFVNVVMLYTRATDSRDRGRQQKGGVRKGYTPEQREAHDRIIHLRDKVVAHHGAAEDQSWTDDRLILAIEPGAVGFRSVFERTLLTRAALQDLRAVLPTAFEWVRSRYSEIEATLNEQLQDRLQADPALWDTVAASRFDPVAYFGPGPLAEAFEAGGEEGTFDGHIRWTRASEE